jgi:tRNA (guanine-N7-)-methyltransferase
MNGVASLLSKLEGSESLNRISIWPDDVRLYMARTPRDDSYKFDLIYILHPDPWPKAKHEKRRLLQPEFLADIDRILSPGGLIILGTDHADYFDWAKIQINASNFKILNRDEFAPPSPGLETRYKIKNKFGSPRPFYAVLLRRGEDRPSPERLASLDLTLA